MSEDDRRPDPISLGILSEQIRGTQHPEFMIGEALRGMPHAVKDIVRRRKGGDDDKDFWKGESQLIIERAASDRDFFWYMDAYLEVNFLRSGLKTSLATTAALGSYIVMDSGVSEAKYALGASVILFGVKGFDTLKKFAKYKTFPKLVEKQQQLTSDSEQSPKH